MTNKLLHSPTQNERERERESNSQLESLHNSAFPCNDKNTICHIERSEISQNISDRDISVASLPQYDNEKVVQYDNANLRDISAFSKPQSAGFASEAKQPYDKTRDCHESAYTDSRNDSIICHTEGVARSISKEKQERYFANAQYDKNSVIASKSQDLRGKTRQSRSFFSNLNGIVGDFRNAQLAIQEDCHDFASQNLAMTENLH